MLKSAARLSPIVFTFITLSAQEWHYYGGDSGGTKYSPLKQINKTNVTKLRPVWTYHTGDVSDGSTLPVRSTFEGTPLVIKGVMYVTTPFCRLIALDAETGRELWVFDPKLDRDKVYFSLYVNRGAAYWTAAQPVGTTCVTYRKHGSDGRTSQRADPEPHPPATFPG